MTDTYTEFLEAKVDFDSRTGFDIDLDDIHPALFDHQRLIVQWAVKGGRRAIFAGCGLGKSLMQLERSYFKGERGVLRARILAALAPDLSRIA